MLVLTRKLNESIRVTTLDEREIDVRVVRIDGKQIRLRFESPRDVVICRDELLSGSACLPVASATAPRSTAVGRLVLTRRVGESVVASIPGVGEVKFTLVRVRGNRTQIGTSAPEGVRILRCETLDRDESDGAES